MYRFFTGCAIVFVALLVLGLIALMMTALVLSGQVPS